MAVVAVCADAGVIAAVGGRTPFACVVTMLGNSTPAGTLMWLPHCWQRTNLPACSSGALAIQPQTHWIRIIRSLYLFNAIRCVIKEVPPGRFPKTVALELLGWRVMSWFK